MSASILVVEHGADVAAALARRLRAEGYRVRLAPTGERADWLDGADRPPPVCVAGLVIDVAARAVSLDGQPLRLRRLEYELLLVLARDPRRVFADRELLRLVWGHHTPLATRTLATHASRLRRRLAAAEREAGTAVAGGRWLVNVRGVGYRLR